MGDVNCDGSHSYLLSAATIQISKNAASESPAIIPMMVVI